MGPHFLVVSPTRPNTIIMIARIALFFAFVGMAMAGDVTDLVEDCGSTSVEITQVTMDGCDQDFDDYCAAKRGAAVNGKLYFTVNQPIQSLTCSIYAHLLGVWVPLPWRLPCCQWLQLTLPRKLPSCCRNHCCL